MNYTIGIIGHVPVIAHVTNGQLFCNAAYGYRLYLVSDTNPQDKQLIDEADTATNKPFTTTVPNGYHLQLEPLTGPTP